MDRRVLVAVAVLAAVGAVVVSMVSAPNVSPALEQGQAQGRGSPQKASGPSSVANGLGAASGGRGLTAAEALEVPVGDLDDPGLWDDTPDEEPDEVRGATITARCQRLGLQTNLVHDMVNLEAEGLVTPQQELALAPRLAALSMQVLADAEKVWSGDMACEGLPELDFGSAEALLTRLEEHPELDEEDFALVTEAVSALGAHDWGS